MIIMQRMTPEGVWTHYDDGMIALLPYRIDEETGEEYIEMFPNDEPTTPLGGKIVAGLEELRAALASGEALDEAFRMTAVDRETGERIEVGRPRDEDEETER